MIIGLAQVFHVKQIDQAREHRAELARTSTRATIARMPHPSVNPTAVTPERPAPGAVSEEVTRNIEDFLPPYRVILHNDDVNSMEHVIHALLDSVPELDQARAEEVMMAAHSNGSAEVIRCPLERAELYRDRLESFRLTATLEKA